MKLLVKVLEHEFIDTILTQEIIDSEVVIDEDLKDFSVARFTMPLIEIKEYNIVEIYEIGNTDKRIFRGYVYKIKPIRKQFSLIDVECRGEKALMNDRCILSIKTFVSQPVATILTDLLDDYSIYGETWTLEVGFTKNISLDLKIGDNYFDVFDEIAKQCDCLWTIQDKKVIFKKELGIDRTSGDDYQEINYNGLFVNNVNISNIEVEGTATRNNIVIGIDSTGITNKQEDFDDRIYGVGTENFRDGDLTEKTQKLLSTSNKNQRVYQVDVEQNTLDVNIGDKVKLIVENTNSFFDINSSVYVISKITTYNNGSKIVKYKIGELNIEVMNIQNWLYGVQKSIKLLKIG